MCPLLRQADSETAVVDLCEASRWRALECTNKEQAAATSYGVRRNARNSLDWKAFGFSGTASVTEEQKASLCGGCEQPMQPPGSLFPPEWGAHSLTAQGGGAPPPGQRFTAVPGLPLALPPGLLCSTRHVAHDATDWPG